jgi:uncharacterized membrane protein YkgB
VSEWVFGALLLLGFWNKTLGALGALGFCFSMISTFTILSFVPGAWAASAGGFPAMTETGAFLMKDLGLFAASFYLLKQDIVRASASSQPLQEQLKRAAGAINPTRKEAISALRADRVID